MQIESPHFPLRIAFLLPEVLYIDNKYGNCGILFSGWGELENLRNAPHVQIELPIEKTIEQTLRFWDGLRRAPR